MLLPVSSARIIDHTYMLTESIITTFSNASPCSAIKLYQDTIAKSAGFPVFFADDNYPHTQR